MLNSALKAENATSEPCKNSYRTVEVQHLSERTRKNKQPTRDWKPAMVMSVWKYRPPTDV